MGPKTLAFLEVLTLSSPFILLIGIFIGLLYYRKLEDSHKLLLAYLIVALLTDITSRILGLYYNNNLILIPVFGMLEVIILSRLYFKHLIRIKAFIWTLPILLLIGFNLYEIFQLISSTPQDFSSFSRVLDSLAIVILSIVFFIKQIAQEQAKKTAFLMLNTIIFAFQSLNLILYLPINFLINESSNIKFHFWTLSLILTLLFYTFIIRTIWIYGKTRKF